MGTCNLSQYILDSNWKLRISRQLEVENIAAGSWEYQDSWNLRILKQLESRNTKGHVDDKDLYDNLGGKQ